MQRSRSESVVFQREQPLDDLLEVVAHHIRRGEHIAVRTFETSAPAGEAPGPFGAMAVPGVDRHEGELMRWNAEGLRRGVVDGGGGLPRPDLLSRHDLVDMLGETRLLQKLGSGIRVADREATDP